jgi:hypothetical protein
VIFVRVDSKIWGKFESPEKMLVRKRTDSSEFEVDPCYVFFQAFAAEDSSYPTSGNYGQTDLVSGFLIAFKPTQNRSHENVATEFTHSWCWLKAQRSFRARNAAQCAQSDSCSWRIRNWFETSERTKGTFFLPQMVRHTHTLLHPNRAHIVRQLQCDCCNFELPSWILGFPWKVHTVVPWFCFYVGLSQLRFLQSLCDYSSAKPSKSNV